MGKIISILFLVILIIGLPFGIYLALNKTQFFSKAGSDDVPRDVKITNISDNGFTVTWMTLKAVPGFVNFGKSDSLGQNSSDDRDETGPKSRITHHVTLKNLDPSTNYFFKVGSGSKVYDYNGKAYTQPTAPTTAQPPAVPEPIFGKVKKADGSLSSDALVYIKIGSSSLLSSYTRADGNFLITLNNARIEDLSDYITVNDSDLINMEVVSEGGSIKTDIPVSEGKEGVSLTLGKPTTSQETTKEPAVTQDSEDLNGDGKVNSIDAALKRQKQAP